MAKNLGDGFVRVRPDTSTFAKETHSGLSGGLRKVAGLVAGAFAGRAVFRALDGMVGKASDLNETVNKADIIFGRQSRSIMRWSKNSDTAFGLSQQAALGAAASFGDMFSQIGFADKASARMSKSTVRMAADLGSFNNLDTGDVLDRISAGLRGEYDSLQKVIPNINAARVESVALAQTGKTVAKELTAQEKAAATLAIIHKDGARATGDYKRTQDGLANSNKTVGAQVDNLKTKVGNALLPIWAATSKTLRTEVLPPLTHLADKYLPKVADGVSKWIGSGDPGKMFGQLKSGLSGINWAELGAGITTLGSAAKQLGPALKDVSIDTVNDGLNVFSTVIKFAADNIGLLEKALPFLVAGFVALKAAQVANNTVGRDSLVGFGLQIGSTLSLAASNRMLVKSQQQVAAATISATGAENAGAVSRIRGAAATVASTVASKAAQLATKAWAAAQWVLNAAMTANPIGLIVAGIALLIAGAVLAYHKVTWFRTAVDAVWGALKTVGSFIADVFVGYLKLMAKAWLTVGIFGVKALRLLLIGAFKTFDGILSAAEKGLGWIPKFGPKISAARKAFDAFGDRTIDKLDKLGNKLETTKNKLDGVAKDRSATITFNYRYVGLRAPGGTGGTRGRDDDLARVTPRKSGKTTTSGRVAAAGGVLSFRIENWAEGIGYILGLADDQMADEIAYAGTIEGMGP